MEVDCSKDEAQVLPDEPSDLPPSPANNSAGDGQPPPPEGPAQASSEVPVVLRGDNIPDDIRGIDMRGHAHWLGDHFLQARKGTRRPPHVHPDMWNKIMNDKQKLETIKEYEKKLSRERAEKEAEDAAKAAPSDLPAPMPAPIS